MPFKGRVFPFDLSGLGGPAPNSSPLGIGACGADAKALRLFPDKGRFVDYDTGLKPWDDNFKNDLNLILGVFRSSNKRETLL